ncbi:GNAT family N-acetyltransferase [Pseudoalteromonas shioyasakiensis]|uniref:GNAT family N-acetyltransferase n=1 Tax=Pseudoalteromonas shioyasakiensis TaxID=1190813 RepID=A0ABT6TXB8_9GAMM|nr:MULTISPECIES: GNAT family N-acetyltransferase [Pseudoalteromonas]MDI4667909.1 GNAT family N-acetyltransferase [Pseudoalteromonas shioyasakiensis]MDI4672861.1 GNAT family N-acetyltransferase [Pseudoalteromonas shioyasakiensis]MDI4684925.1 GNAT family N-acetyltransferase [Pseudoalteromonas shioyasakiensis]MDI4703111.1 GNAT family N-acetyltransferase [Pseudoalteromonas shioyasakiensis]NUJ20262.1 GNAT family N-acetyltransferase [Pseudoalteromonas sp. 0802]
MEKSYIIKPASLDDLLLVDSQIPEFDGRNTLSKLQTKCADVEHLALVAYIDNEPVAYKLGYALDSNTFYSWLGAVAPKCRGQGIAQALLNAQEAWVKVNNYRAIKVKSMNRFPAMLSLLIKNGYAIAGYEDRDSPQTSKILFTKDI